MFNPGDEVFVVADGSRRGQGGVVEQVLPGVGEQESYQVCVIAFLSDAGKAKECYFVKELRATTSRVNNRT